MKYQSHAQWAPGVFCGGDTTTDTHHSLGEAEGVCRLLEKNGFGGDHQHFPLRTWTTPLPETEEEREEIIHADVFNPAESDLDYFLRRKKELGI